MADSDHMTGGHRSLLRIAHILGVSPDVFSHLPGGASDEPPSAAEEAELLDLFRTIGCVRSRRRCLDMVRTMVPAGRPPVGGGG